MLKFSIGDVVRLKSGGPLMTITETFTNGKCCCTWFKELQDVSSIFVQESLYSLAEVEQQKQDVINKTAMAAVGR
ncbi:YodC family protein [Aeromonas tecta]|uniref:YodC family protein n=1 Tax=Aeromonas tecta TaxID=324617 RepID=UPI0012FBCEC7|nr:DUF2158 domain-containing protein [Aeromonas tecta]